MSTVGSASATGSVGGRTTTWASGSAKGGADEDEREVDQMSMDASYRDDERDRFSASAAEEEGEGNGDGDGMSDDTSLVGFGEGAGSTVSGPTYSRSNLVPKNGLASHIQSSGSGTPLSASTTATAEQQRGDARMIDGLADDTASDYVDTAARGGGVGIRGSGFETTERTSRDRFDDGEGRKPLLGSPDESHLGKFYFEEKK